MLLLEPPEPAARHLLPPGPGLPPNLVEVPPAAVVLCYPNGVRDVQDRVPPALRYEHRLACVLRELIALEVGVLPLAAARGRLPLYPGQDRREVVYRLVVLAAQDELTALDDALRHVGREEHPPLHADDERVPRARPQGVDVDRGAGPARAHQEPPVGRPPTLADEAQEVLVEVLRHLVLVQYPLGHPVLVEGRVEYVQRRVIAVVHHVLYEVAQLDPDRVPVVVLAALEVALGQVRVVQERLDRPLVHRRPLPALRPRVAAGEVAVALLLFLLVAFVAHVHRAGVPPIVTV
mmetsp:Transcript_28298/g.64386  ORF Transcript_28298/g.64386 Transcript_28298/m.64386 type:complete len:292 (-) Transcript_28298:279-1154(-)